MTEKEYIACVACDFDAPRLYWLCSKYPMRKDDAMDWGVKRYREHSRYPPHELDQDNVKLVKSRGWIDSIFRNPKLPDSFTTSL
jgi:hypothetical protein